ncbi:MAG: tetratricopeptide repeat protein [Saprospiraceae bacterium]|nr:tetratricopeptide repeat protein [Bacteroidia bacterium]NNE14828.1 tetratricopeptide repeat protein [Saprospiraceae bacterium]NNL90613.1 tetratricopeptide repeat protein [Saprospiraceae bacterium]
MAKKKNKTAKKLKNVVEKPILEKPSFLMIPKWHLIMIFGLATILYANTLGHDYTQDDAIVIYDNMFTQQGLSGIPGILKYDTFYGFFKEEGKAKLVAGGRYRPFTLIMFAIEWQLFGRSPLVGHLINILLYGLLGLFIYKLLDIMLVYKKKNPELSLVIFFAAIFFIAHPIHTEAVANIKGRDEIMTFLGAVIALWASFKYYYKPESKWMAVTIISFFIALMSKENAITFLAIVPLSFYFFTKSSFIESLKRTWPFLLSSTVFIAIRFSILGMDFGDKPQELMNNPFLKIVNNTYVDFSFTEWLATIMFTLGKYIQLLIVPHPLSHDYYPRAIDVMTFSNWQSLLSTALYIGLVYVAFKTWKKNKIISYCVLFYLITLSIVSNIVFPIGTNMSERFIFIPSLGFTLLLSYLLYKYLPSKKMFIGVGLLLTIAYSFKTITRNTVWKNDFTLFTTDVKTNGKSAKLLNAAAGALTTTAATMKDGQQRTEYLTQAVAYLEDAIKIHPTYRNAYLLLGNANYYLKDFEKSIKYFDHSLVLDPDFKDALKNLPIVLRDGGRYMGQQKKNFPKAQQWLERSYAYNAQDYETCRLLGITYGIQNIHGKAIEFFNKAIAIRPDIAANYTSLGTAYMNNGQEDKAREAFNKAVELDPKALNHMKK